MSALRSRVCQPRYLYLCPILLILDIPLLLFSPLAFPSHLISSSRWCSFHLQPKSDIFTPLSTLSLEKRKTAYHSRRVHQICASLISHHSLRGRKFRNSRQPTPQSKHTNMQSRVSQSPILHPRISWFWPRHSCCCVCR
jgi:hypothetical protein